MKKNISVFLAVLMMVSSFTVFSFAVEDEVIEFKCEVLERAVKDHLQLYGEEDVVRQSDALQLEGFGYGVFRYSMQEIDTHPDDELITSLKGLEHFTNLKTLTLSQNFIEDLEPIKHLTNLERLYLRQNKIKNIEPIAQLKNLKILDLSDNEIEDISFLEALEELTWIDLSHNPIEDFTSLLALTELEALYLNNTGLEDVSFLNNFKNLYQFSLSRNYITDLTPLFQENGLITRARQDLEGNKDSYYFFRLDYNQISEEQVEKHWRDLVSILSSHNQGQEVNQEWYIGGQGRDYELDSRMAVKTAHDNYISIRESVDFEALTAEELGEVFYSLLEELSAMDRYRLYRPTTVSGGFTTAMAGVDGALYGYDEVEDVEGRIIQMIDFLHSMYLELLPELDDYLTVEVPKEDTSTSDHIYDTKDSKEIDLSGVSSWALESIEEAIEKNIATEKVLSDFSKNITREEFAEIIVKVYEYFSDDTVDISDEGYVDTDNQLILKASALGIIQGVGNNNFAPDNLVTREQVAAMYYRLLDALEFDPVTTDEYVYFSDEEEIADWGKAPVQLLNKIGIINGLGNERIAPKENATREQALVMSVRLLEYFEEK